MKTFKVRLTFMREVLGSLPGNPEVFAKYIASKAPDAKTMEEEIEANGVQSVQEESMTVFPRTAEGLPCLLDYQVTGFFKEACSCLRRASKTKSQKLTAFKKVIDGLVFIEDRENVFQDYEELGSCQRSLRASTPQGERTSLACSETIPAGATVELGVKVLSDDLVPFVIEWLNYGACKGLLQWRNSGKGRFNWEFLEGADEKMLKLKEELVF